MSDSNYDPCYRFTQQWEGGYVNHPSDPGGCTNKGITIHTLRAWRGTNCTCDDIKTLSDDEAGQIYASNYWRPVWGGELPNGLDLCVWDWGVNSGPRRAVKKLQQMVGSSADGKMGPNTMAAVRVYVDKVGIATAITDYLNIRQTYYESLSTFNTFGKGWTNRVDSCRYSALNMTPKIPIQ